MSEKQSVLITGGKGWIAGIIKPYLESKQMQAFTYDIKDGEDLFDEGTLESHMAKVDTVLHMAAIPHFIPSIPWGEFERMNVVGTDTVCRMANKLEKRFVMISSGAVYGFDKGFMDPNVRPLPLDYHPPLEDLNFYAKSKVMAENKVKENGGGVRVILRVNWPGGCDSPHLLSVHLGAEVGWNLLGDIIHASLIKPLDEKVYVFNAVNPTLRDGKPALVEVQNRLETLGI